MVVYLCISGSAMYFMGTGMSYSHTSIFLSSEVVTNFLPSSKKLIVLHACKW